jgi:hypothetical protein
MSGAGGESAPPRPGPVPAEPVLLLLRLLDSRDPWRACRKPAANGKLEKPSNMFRGVGAPCALRSPEAFVDEEGSTKVQCGISTGDAAG